MLSLAAELGFDEIFYFLLPSAKSQLTDLGDQIHYASGIKLIQRSSRSISQKNKKK